MPRLSHLQDVARGKGQGQILSRHHVLALLQDLHMWTHLLILAHLSTIILSILQMRDNTYQRDVLVYLPTVLWLQAHPVRIGSVILGQEFYKLRLGFPYQPWLSPPCGGSLWRPERWKRAEDALESPICPCGLPLQRALHHPAGCLLHTPIPSCDHSPGCDRCFLQFLATSVSHICFSDLPTLA